MTHSRCFARAGALAWLVLAAGLFALPTDASPPSDPSTTNDGATAAATAEDPAPPAEATMPPATATATTDSPPDATDFAPPSESETSPPFASTTEAPSASGLPPSETPSEATLSPTSAATFPLPTDPVPSTVDLSVTKTPTDSAPFTATSTLATSATATLTQVPTELAASTSTATLEASATATVTPTPTATATPTGTVAPPQPQAFGAGAVILNEVAWAGSLASANDEWIELWNPGPQPIDLRGWILTDGDDLTAALAGEIAAHGLFLMERTDDSTVSDVGADLIYTGSLNNGGETLKLLDPSGTVIDTANASGGAWPAGDASGRASMERHGALDVPANWSTFSGFSGNGLDADGLPIAGTPRRPNAPSAPLATATPSPTPTGTPPISTPFPAKAVIINEVAWTGTLASTSDEWIELLNPGSEDIPLDGWRLTDDGDIDVGLSGVLAGGNYYVLERSDDRTISDRAADRIYSGALSNEGERLRLIDPSGAEIDVVNAAAGAWPAGDAGARASMERVSGVWRTFNGFYGLGLDADGRAVRGTPYGPNSGLFPTPLPTWIPGRVVINEVLVRPHYDWEGAGGVTTDDEFIEIYNRGPGAVNLKGWTLDDYVVGGSKPYELPGITMDPGEFAVFFRSRTQIALNDSGDSVRLSAPDGSPVDKIRYLRVRAYNLSYGRLPDGDDVLVYGLWPTPGEGNVLYTPPSFPAGAILINEIAWAGTLASANDEWVELWNPGSASIHLDGWVLTDDDDIHIDLRGILPAGGYALFERTDDGTISDLPAHGVYTGALSDNGERLRLIDPSGHEVDVVNPGGEAWPAGDDQERASMERVEDEWLTFAGDYGRGLDTLAQTIRGTPGGVNSEVAALAITGVWACSEGGSRIAGPCP